MYQQKNINMSASQSRRDFLQNSLVAGFGIAAGSSMLSAFETAPKRKMQLGLVTYQWASDWNLPTLLANCEKAGLLGVELRTQHAHGVEISLSPAKRSEVKKMFADTPVTCLGYGSNFEFHSNDPVKLRQNIDQTKEYIRLCKDIGATGIKVKPNGLVEGVPKEKTLTQIAVSLNEVGKYAKDYGQLIRVEVHGSKTAEIPNIKTIFDQVTEKNVKICWNSNPQDLLPPGLDANFNLIKKWFGDTIHLRDLATDQYPYQHLFKLLTNMKYKGWLLLEESSNPQDKVAAMKEQLNLFNQLLITAGRA
jgi:sugar phosphate isomerase/epimerase